MPKLNNKRIILGVTGGIAAYKAADFIRKLKEQGAQVRCIMTEGAKAFITPMTLQALSGNPVHTTLLDVTAEAGMGHIALARWADFIVAAPASANFLARLAAGHADDLLTTCCLASSAPVAVAPAMNQRMWRNDATVQNIATLKKNRIHVWGPAEGSQACGDVGPGRLLEPAELIEHLVSHYKTGCLQGKRVLITAGPTQEPIDAVRFISNRSSGKMGYALAEAAIDAGATVTLISGPVSLTYPDRVQCVDVNTAQEMHDAVANALSSTDIFIGCAAVTDFSVKHVTKQKIKKQQLPSALEITENPDIVAMVANQKNKPFTVGFAAETHDVIAYAKNKLKQKKLDLIIANDVSQPETGFGSDKNTATAVWPAGEKNFELMSKQRLAREIVTLVGDLI